MPLPGLVVNMDQMQWVRATVPKQGERTNDCGVVASCFSLLHVHSLQKAGLLKDKPPKKVKPLESATLELPEGMSMHEFGRLGRSCMLRATKHAKLEWTGQIFEAKVEWS